MFGGFRGADSKEQVDKWLNEVFWQAGVAQPAATYIKCDKDSIDNYNGIVFGKYTVKTERDAVVRKVRPSGLQCDAKKIWSKVDQPLDVRI